MCWWWHFDRGNFDLTGPRLSHESKCVSRALEMEGRSLWLWHTCEGLRLLGVKCDTSLGRCWFSVAAAQQTSSHGGMERRWGGWEHQALDREWGPTALHPQGRHLTACKSCTYAKQTLPPFQMSAFLQSLNMHFFNHKGALCNFFWTKVNVCMNLVFFLSFSLVWSLFP